MTTFEIFKKDAFAKFRSLTHPQLATKDADFVKEISTWYERIFAEEMKYTNCGVCLYEKFKEMTDLTQKMIDERLNLPYVINENNIIWHKGTPYSRKSPHLTAEIMGEIAANHPGKVGNNPYFVENKPVEIEEAPHRAGEAVPKPAPTHRKKRK